MNDARCHAFFAGQVQGVGFRWKTRQLALNHRLRGWVRNLPDGRVELQAEGDPAAIEAFFLDLRAEFSGLIRRVERAGIPPEGTDQDFTIRR